MTTLVGALTIGLGVTYAIHISHRFIEELEEHHSLEKAVNNTVKNTGFSLFGAAMTTVLSWSTISINTSSNAAIWYYYCINNFIFILISFGFYQVF